MIRSSRRDDTKDHEFYKERLSAYLDDELTARERRAVEQHLKACETCHWELATLKQTVAWLSELSVVPLPRVFTIPANVVPAPAVRRRQWSFVPAMQLATALVAVLLFFAAAGDVMLTGWPWATTAEPAMLQQAPGEQPAADALAEKEVELTLEVEAATITEPYGAAGAAESAPAEPTGVAEAPAAAPLQSEAPEEAPLVMQEAAPEASARAVAPTEPPAGMGSGEGEAPPAEAEAAVAADAEPSAPPPAGTLKQPPTATPAPLPAEPQAPEAAFVPPPTALPTIHPPATAAAAEPPAALVQAPEPLAARGEVRDEAESGALTGGETDWAVFWLRVIEYVLGVVLVVLAGATMVLMVWRRRTHTR